MSFLPEFAVFLKREGKIIPVERKNCRVKIRNLPVDSIKMFRRGESSGGNSSGEILGGF
jgi:hypothetical protein